MQTIYVKISKYLFTSILIYFISTIFAGAQQVTPATDWPSGAGSAIARINPYVIFYSGGFLHISVNSTEQIEYISFKCRHKNRGPAPYPKINISYMQAMPSGGLSVQDTLSEWYTFTGRNKSDVWGWFTNDARTGAWDTNLIIDSVSVTLYKSARVDTFMAHSLRVYWNKNTESDLSGYIIKRVRNDTPLTVFEQTDTTFNIQETFSALYKVSIQAKDSSGLVSDPASVTFFMDVPNMPVQIDTLPPAVPTGINVEADTLLLYKIHR